MAIMVILVLINIIYTEMVTTKSYDWSYVGNLCPRLDLVLICDWIASVWFSGTEICTDSFCYRMGCWIGACFISTYLTGNADCYSNSVVFSLVVRPWSDGEMNVVDGSCRSEYTNTNFFLFTNLHMTWKYLGRTRFSPQPLIVVKEGSNKMWNCH